MRERNKLRQPWDRQCQSEDNLKFTGSARAHAVCRPLALWRDPTLSKAPGSTPLVWNAIGLCRGQAASRCHQADCRRHVTHLPTSGLNNGTGDVVVPWGV
eukprot:1987475-Amphidinium_carterae.1